MKTIFTALCVLLAIFSVRAQSISGKVLEADTGEPLIGASILVVGTTRGTVTNVDGIFTLQTQDSCLLVSVSYVGFTTAQSTICRHAPNQIALAQMTTLDEVVVVQQYPPPLPPPPPPPPPAKEEIFYSVTSSFSSAYQGATRDEEPEHRESYAPIQENGFQSTAVEKTSTFGLDVDAASYSNVRRFLLADTTLPPKDAVRSEEMINYFNYSHRAPDAGGHPVAITTELATCPWAPDHQLLMVGVRAQAMAAKDLPPSNIVFLIDVSGSMLDRNKLPLLVESFKLLTNNLREQDKVAIVTYAGRSGLVLPATSGANQQKIKAALDALQAGGSTAGAAGIELAYRVARENFVEGGNNRIILATDGDFNVGVSSNTELETLITRERESGIFLSLLGFGTGNLQDDKMQLLADKGNGNHAYIDQLDEAKKVLVNEFGGTLFTVAKDVKLQVIFDPKSVSQYRLVGYENRLLNNADFKDDTKDAGELGAGHTVTALYEIVPAKRRRSAAGSVAEVRLRYKQPDAQESIEMQTNVAGLAEAFGQCSLDLRWAAAVAEFAMLLRQSEHKGIADYAHCETLARQAQGRDPFGYRAEMIRMIQAAARLVAEEK